jgi:TolB-like protein
MIKELNPAAEVAAEKHARKEKKAREKVRSAWISFVGRIVAQIVGAVATISLGLIIADRIHHAPAAPAGAAHLAPAMGAALSAGGPADAPPGDGRLSIAVLPLQNLSGDAGHDHLADGMTEALIAGLAKVEALRVISRTSVMPYKGAQKTLPAIARELGADLIVEGSVLRDGPRVRVIAQLIDAKKDAHLWAESYDRDASDLLSIQTEVVQRITTEVQGALASAGSPTLSILAR